MPIPSKTSAKPLPQPTSFSKELIRAELTTPIGQMIAIADEQQLYLLEFVHRKALPRELERLRCRTKLPIHKGRTKIIDLLEKELAYYFAGTLRKFTIPLSLMGSPFQKEVWQGLMKIPYGATRSYLSQTLCLGHDRHKVRAVANANGANQIAILIPCHRIINHNGALGGYGGGLERKKWLLQHEKRDAENEIIQISY